MEARFTYADKLPATVRFRIRMKFRLREMPTSTSRTTRFGPRPIAALLALQLGLLAVVLASTPFKQFDLDRFFVPKELALHVAAFLAVVFCLNRLRNVSLDRVDYFLIAFALLSLVSALLASNRWLSMRSVAVTLSGLATFWCARSLARAGLKRPLVAVIVLATVVGAATSLVQAYGVESEYFTLSRAPGGTFGNRNFVAHVAAIGAPLLIWYAVSAKRNIAVVLCAIGGAEHHGDISLRRDRVPDEQWRTYRGDVCNKVAIAKCAAGRATECEIFALNAICLDKRSGGSHDCCEYDHRDEWSLEPRAGQ